MPLPPAVRLAASQALALDGDLLLQQLRPLVEERAPTAGDISAIPSRYYPGSARWSVQRHAMRSPKGGEGERFIVTRGENEGGHAFEDPTEAMAQVVATALNEVEADKAAQMKLDW